MNPQQSRIGILSVVLMLPALFLSTAGILYLAFGLEGANRIVEALMSTLAGKLLLSRVVVLGGPILAAILNAWKVFHLSADVINEEFVIALSVKKLFGHLTYLALAGGLLLLLLLYGFVENFQIVAR
jgi:hypothetical protein